MPRAFIFALVLISQASPASSAVPLTPLWSHLEPGPHPVGFQVAYVLDNSRSFESAEPSTGYCGRPIRILTWYPGAASGLRPRMRFGDYLRVEPDNPVFGKYNELLQERDQGTAARQFVPPDPKLTEILLATETAAYRDLPFAGGRHPLVMHSLGLNDFQQESTVLWEYLASHGYIVATVPQIGPSMTQHRLRWHPEDLEIQKRDLGFALAHMVDHPGVDASRVGLMGHSAGAVAAVLLAAENRNVDALVSLEGSINHPDGWQYLTAAGWDPASQDVPVLQLFDAAKQDLDWRTMDAMVNAERFNVGFGRPDGPVRSTHYDFQNWPIYSVLTGVEDVRGKFFRPPEAGRDFYLGACRLTRHFLDFVLRDRTEARRWIEGRAQLPHVDAEQLYFRHQEKTEP